MIRTTFFPKTRLGKWSVGLFIIFILLSAATNLIPPDERAADWPDIFKAPLFSMMVYSLFTAAIGAAITGILAVKKKVERSVLVYVAIPLGLLYASGLIVMGVGLVIQMF